MWAAMLATSAAPWSRPGQSIAPAAVEPGTPRRALRRGGDAGPRRRHPRAIAAFQALAAANPDDFDSRVWLGRLLTRVGRRAEAITLLQDVITRSPRQVDARVALGAALLTGGRVDGLRGGAGRRGAGAGQRRRAGAQGPMLRRLGRPSDAYVALDLAHALSPRDEDIDIVRERTRRMSRTGPTSASPARRRRTASPKRRLSMPTSTSTSTTGAGVRPRAVAGTRRRRRHPRRRRRRVAAGSRVLSRGALLVSPGSPRVAQADSSASSSSPPAGRSRPSASATSISPRRASGSSRRRSASTSPTPSRSRRATTAASRSSCRAARRQRSGAVMGRWQARRRLSLSAAYARGNESFESLGRSARTFPRRHGGGRRAHRSALADLVRARGRAPVAQRRSPAHARHARPRPAF